MYHPQCFLCAQCKKPIDGGYQELKGKYYHPHCYREKTGLFCAKCGKLLEESWVEQQGKKYHAHCLAIRCHICGQLIVEDYVYDKDGKYHQHCFLNRKAPRCSVCDLPIQGKHMVDSWGNRAHEHHGKQKTEICEYCGRIVSEATSNSGELYRDGRLVCGICKLTAVIGGQRLEGAQARVKKLLAAPPASFQDIPHPVPVQLVDLPTLIKLGGSHIFGLSRGFTRSHIIYENNKQIKVEHTIYILYGMPLIQFEAVLAHELLHAWLTAKEIALSEKETEGFCNLGSALVFQAESSPYSRLMVKHLQENPDRIYGDGYRLMNQRLQKLGWQRLKVSL